MQKVSILGKETIFVGSNLCDKIAEQVFAYKKFSAVIIVCDENVASLHLQTLLSSFQKLVEPGYKLLTFVCPPGEVHKNRIQKAKIEDFMLSNACTRDSCLIALGGGVIGDMVGFVAANFMRGIPVVQVPTTLLAMVDSAVGGKTAIDTPHGKNLIGAFHQPIFVFIDIEFLKTLPRREFVNGLAEVIKTAAIWNEKDFDLLENYPEKILSLVGEGPKGVVDKESQELLTRVILGSVQVKAHVVTVDEKETGLRGLLNFGHSIGHAIEAIVFPDLLHGECVSIGMVLEAELSRNLGHLSNVSVGRLVRCLQSYGLPVSLHDKIYKQRTKKVCPVEKMMTIMKVDKKNVGAQKKIVLLSAIGKTFEPNASFVQDNFIRNILSPAMQVIPQPASKSEIALNVPGSKSISNRALVMAALGKGPCRLRGLLHSDDVQVMLDALQKLVGIKFAWEDDGNTLLIEGGEGKLKVPEKEIYLGNAGTASRFLTTVCSLIKESSQKSTILTGNARMKQRPIGPLVQALRANGSKIKCLETEGCFPLEIEPSGLAGGIINLSASVSSQYVSSILISGPYANQPVVLDLTGDSVISQPYIDMTIAMMKSFGIEVKREGTTNKYHIPLGVYTNPAEYLVEADASSATYPLAFAAITGSTVTVTNIGSKSLQGMFEIVTPGDSEFAVKVLKPMGCTVTQTETTTTVTGPKNLLPIPSIDMETMTDAFMTATVLAAVAQDPYNNDDQSVKHVTRITGIANQRVKECDRIAAMIEQLRKQGVKASELPDGIEIIGIDRVKLKNPAPAGIKCYDDHRIAMSFSVLGCAYPVGAPGPIITEKKCVEKTWPSWWDTLQNTLKIDLVGVDIEPPHAEKPDNTRIDAEKSIVLVGMRGAGKTHMGKAGALHLGRKFIDMDHYLEEKAKITIPNYIAANGWESFRELEAKCLNMVLSVNSTGHVIACGGGIVEGQSSREALTKWSGLVVHIRRNIDRVEEYLSIDKTRPMYGEDMRAVWKRRETWYLQCSNAEFVVLSPVDHSETNSKIHYGHVEESFGRFLDFKLSSTPWAFPTTELSFFVSLTDSNIEKTITYLDKASVGANALELRVDLLESTEMSFVGEQLALLRSISRLPIVFTVRTVKQGGKFPDNAFEDMQKLLFAAFRWGCEYVDIEFSPPLDRFSSLISAKGNSRIIASYHDPKGEDSWDANGSMIKKYQELHPLADVIKLIGKASSFGDNFVLHEFTSKTVPALGLQPKPLIALLMGSAGQLSRSLNSFLTPVTHPSIPVPAAPGQVSISQIHQVRNGIGLLQPKSFCLFGSPISKSMSPTLHNAGFAELGLPYKYTLSETSDVRDVVEVMKTKNGASVTIPLKMDVMPICNSVDDSAKSIGAVNTLVKSDDGKISGYNTDWIGIKKSILKRLPAKANVVGIVLGGGGTSRAALYALQKIENIQKIKIWNRTFTKAQSLAAEFGGVAVKDLENIMSSDHDQDPATVFIVIGTIPSSAQEGLPLAEMYAKASKYSLGIVVDMAYTPRKTLLLLSSESAAPQWHRIEGIEVLLEQGFEQFEMWTGIQSPKSVIKDRVYAQYE